MTVRDLYSDNLVNIDPDKITFSSYYFPFSKKKSVALDQIEYILAKRPTIWSGKYRISRPGLLWIPQDLKEILYLLQK